MAKKKKIKAIEKPVKETKAEGIKRLSDGRYQTPDLRCFDTLLKASKHLLTINQ